MTNHSVMAMSWWKTGVLYQIYPRSFADSNGDGVGDLPGVINHLDHLEWLGVDGIWLSPITVSPNADWGYDVADYCGVQPEYGTLEDLDRLVDEAGRRHIRVLLDLVPNHTSDRHPWFLDGRSSPAAAHRDWYVWADPKGDGSPPNNWVSAFGGPAWTFDEPSGQYYLHNFLPEQPDLNWWNEEVREVFDRILRFWFDRGVAGFRIDVCHMIVKDALLRDNPPATPDDHWTARVFGQRPIYNANRPEVHDVLRRWRRLAETYAPARLLLGETNVDDVETTISFYGHGNDEVQLAFNFPFINAEFEAEPLRAVVQLTEALIPPSAWPVWTASNHDVSRLATRWAKGDGRKIRAALVLLLTLRGTPVLYQGDEIGLPDTHLAREDLLDPVGVRFWPAYAGRDPVRTPMPWQNQPGGGFTPAGVKPWLPLGDVSACNVDAQRDDPGSVLTLARELIALRRATPDLQNGDYVSLSSPPEVWAWRRGATTVIVVNLSDHETVMDGRNGRIALSTNRGRHGQALSGGLELGPWEAGIIVSS
ncbi:MAG TPA: alpha-amylase family glycosyl hydrolase [Acidimicrobiales bacterium]|nr:alpha-amylase family glycosyl hydrolase [Acidimicrobiales bacterium]